MVYEPKAGLKDVEQYQRMYETSIKDPEKFWSSIAGQFVWEKEWDAVLESNFDTSCGPVSNSWFIGGRTNLAWNCVDANIDKGLGDSAALIWEGNEPGEQSELTYKELRDEVNKLANWLILAGVKPGDRVVVYLPMLLELPTAMLACARIGAVHSVVFGGFSAESLSQRI